jgi:hypothetical protein
MEMEFRLGQEITMNFGIGQEITADFGLGSAAPEPVMQVIPVIPVPVLPICEN